MAAEAVCKYGVSALVTGAGRGIGLELCRLLTEAGCNVYATVRKESEALSKVGVAKVISGVDMTSDDLGSVVNAGLGDDLKLDLVINNAGMLMHETYAELNLDGIKKQFDVNALGPLRVVKAVEARLGEGSKVANVTSRMGSIADADSGNMYGYRMSKAALNMATKCLATDLGPRRIAVCCLHPGHVATDMGGSHAAVSPTDSAQGLLDRIEGLTLETSGKFWHMNGEELPW